MNDQWRIGKRVGQQRWQIKQAPGWRVAHQCDTLQEAAAWLAAQGVDAAAVHVLTESYPWKTLAQHISPNGVIGLVGEGKCSTCMHSLEEWKDAPVCVSCIEGENWEQANVPVSGVESAAPRRSA